MKPPPMAVDPNRLCRSGEDLGEKPSLVRQGWPWKVSKFCPRASEFACDGNRPDHSSRQHEGATVSRLGCCIRDRTVTRHQLLRAPECPPLGGFLIPPAMPVEHHFFLAIAVFVPVRICLRQRRPALARLPPSSHTPPGVPSAVEKKEAEVLEPKA